jgi:anti-anti-sigma regulatory factor
LPAALASPLPPDEATQVAMRRVWKVYDATHAEMQDRFRQRLADHPEFGPLIQNTPPDPAEEERSHLLLCAALERGDWQPYWQNIRSQAAGYANAEITLSSWIELIHLARDDVLDRIVAAHHANGPGGVALIEEIKALDAWLDATTAVFAQEFVATNEQVIARQQQAIRQLSTPVLQLRPGLLLLPIVGVLDSERLEQLRNGLLDGIRTRRAGAVVLDITGVPEIDTVAAHQLIAAISSANMMGAEVIVSGLSAEIAGSLVDARIDLGRVVSVGDLESGLELAESIVTRAR